MKTLFSYRFGSFASSVCRCPAAEAFVGIDLLVVDSNTRRFAPPHLPVVEIPPGEKNKNIEQLQRILAACAAHQLKRRSCLAALGGGVICDLAGLAASLYMRGCRLVLLPSTLLAMVDAALGGKTGVDFGGYKNLVGSFYPAAELRLLPPLLDHLSARDYRSGLAEVIKHALLAGGPLYRLVSENPHSLLTRQQDQLERILPLAIDVKGQIVSRDLYERGERAHLNLGHTFAHALETVSRFAMTHGEAVAWGLVQAARLSRRLGLCPDSYPKQVQQLVEACGFPLDYAYPLPDLLEAMSYDKKREQRGSVRFVLQRGVGETDTHSLALERLPILLG